MDKTYHVEKVALYFIWKAKNDDEAGKSLTNLKLNKLLYYAQGWYLANNKRPLFYDEIHAWKYGPVVPKIYNLYRNFRDQPLDVEIDPQILSEFGDDDKIFLDTIWNIFKNYSGLDLVATTHVEDPWITTIGKIETRTSYDGEITKDTIQTYFSNLLIYGRNYSS